MIPTLPSFVMRSLSVNEPPEGFVNTLNPVVAPPYNETLDVPLVCNAINASPAFLLTLIFVAENVATPSDAMRRYSELPAAFSNV